MADDILALKAESQKLFEQLTAPGGRLGPIERAALLERHVQVADRLGELEEAAAAAAQEAERKREAEAALERAKPKEE